MSDTPDAPMPIDAVPGAAGIAAPTPATADPPKPKRGPGRPRKAAGAAKKAPAKRSASPLGAAVPQAEPKGPGRPSASAKLAESMALNYAAIGGIIAAASRAFRGPAGDRMLAAGEALQAQARDCGQALANWADTNPKVKAWLTTGSTFGAFGMVLAAHLPIATAVISGPADASVLRLVGDADAASPGDGPSITEAFANLFHMGPDGAADS